MKVLFDFDGFKGDVGGVARCTVDLIEHFPNYVDAIIAIGVCDNVHFLNSSINHNIGPSKITPNNFIVKRHFPGKEALFRLTQKFFPSLPTYRNVNKPISISALKSQNFDLFHCPSTTADTYFLDYLGGKPFVLTVHDMISELFLEPNNIQTRIKRTLIPLASHIVTISQRSKEDLIKLMHVPEDKITVIYHGAPEVISSIPSRLIPEPYFLFVGRRGGYKNFIQTLNDYSIFHKSFPEVKFIATGLPFNFEELKLIKELGLSNSVINLFASESELASLYTFAEGFIFPSLYEGFGLPILEAFSYGCPALLNDTSCFPEIAGDAAIFFHSRPEDRQSDLPEKMTTLYTMSSEQKSLVIRKGKERSRDFSWSVSSMELVKVYEKVLNKS